MQQRLDRQTFYRLQPALIQALRAVGRATEESSLGRPLIELVKIRASQINGCAFCVNMHSVDARKLGEAQERLDLLPVWREAPCFTTRERAALAWTEALTLVADDEVPDDVYAEAAETLGEEELAHLTAAIIVINSWNRIAVGLRFQPPVAQPQSAAKQ